VGVSTQTEIKNIPKYYDILCHLPYDI